jgi:hypothetical protein
MALLTATRPTAGGTTIAGAAVSASDTIAAADLGSLGAYLIVMNGGASPDTVTVSDSGVTPANNPASVTGVSVTNGTNKAIYISPRQVNTTTQVVTVTHSYTTSVTYELLPLG